MREVFIDAIIANLPEIISIFFAVLGAIITKKIIPVLTTANNAQKLNEVIQIAEILVESAYRLDKSGRLENITKKEYVMSELDKYIEEKKYRFTESQLDNIRRAAVVALEQTEVIVSDTISKIEEASK